MSQRRRSSSNAHEWTEFEKHTLLCLMAKGMHLEERGKRSDQPGQQRQHAHLTVATALNDAVHKGDYVRDISKKEVSKMIDRVMEERKGVVGKGGYMERATNGRITRGLKRLWERPTKFDYDGSKSEWDLWRKAKEAEKERITKGGAPKEVIQQAIEDDDDEERDGVTQARVPKPKNDFWRQADMAATSSRTKWRSAQELPTATGPSDFGARAPALNNTNRDGFQVLPTQLRSSSKYEWANPQQASFPAIDSFRPNESFRPSTKSLRNGGSYQGTARPVQSRRVLFNTPQNAGLDPSMNAIASLVSNSAAPSQRAQNLLATKSYAQSKNSALSNVQLPTNVSSDLSDNITSPNLTFSLGEAASSSGANIVYDSTSPVKTAQPVKSGSISHLDLNADPLAETIGAAVSENPRETQSIEHSTRSFTRPTRRSGLNSRLIDESSEESEGDSSKHPAKGVDIEDLSLNPMGQQIGGGDIAMQDLEDGKI